MVEENQWVNWWKTSNFLGDWWRKTKRSKWLVENTSWPMPRRKNRKLGENQEVGKIEKSNFGAEWSGENHVIMGIFCLLSRPGQKRDKKLEVQVFLARLLALLSFADLPRFCLLEASALGLTVGLAIGGAEFIGGEVTIGLFGWLWWKVLMSLQRCSTIEVSSQMFSSLR